MAWRNNPYGAQPLCAPRPGRILVRPFASRLCRRLPVLPVALALRAWAQGPDLGTGVVFGGMTQGLCPRWGHNGSTSRIPPATPGGELIQLHDDHNSTVTGLAWFRDGCGLATTCYGGAELWRVGRREAEKHFQWKGAFLSLSLSPDDKHLAAGCQDASLFVWNVKTGKTVGMAGYASKVGVLGWNAKSRYLASGAGSEAVLWDFSGMIPANCEPLILNGHVDRITDIGFHPTTNTLATAGNDGMLILWQVPEGEMRNLCILTNPLSRLVWSPLGVGLAVGSAEGEIAFVGVEKLSRCTVSGSG